MCRKLRWQVPPQNRDTQQHNSLQRELHKIARRGGKREKGWYSIWSETFDSASCLEHPSVTWQWGVTCDWRTLHSSFWIFTSTVCALKMFSSKCSLSLQRIHGGCSAFVSSWERAPVACPVCPASLWGPWIQTLPMGWADGAAL